MADPTPAPPTIAVCGNVSIAIVLVRRGAAGAASRALRDRHGVDLPPPGRLVALQFDLLLWNGPDRFLAVRDDARPGLAQELTALLCGAATVLEASSSLAVANVSGRGAAEALGRLLPIDLHPRSFTPGSVALTTANHVAVQIWRPGDAAAFRLACPSSYAASFHRFITTDAQRPPLTLSPR